MKLQVLFLLFHQRQNRESKRTAVETDYKAFSEDTLNTFVTFIHKLLASRKCNIIVHSPVWCVFQHYAFHHNPLRTDTLSVFRTVYLYTYLHTYTGNGRSSWARCIVGVFCEVSFVVYATVLMLVNASGHYSHCSQ